MGCGASKSSSALDHNLKGTTNVGFVYSGGIVIGAESRGSNEVKELQDPLRIRDDVTKMEELSSHIIYVVNGVKSDCDEMTEHMKMKFPYVNNAVRGTTPYSVSCVVETMYKYMESLDEKKRCGAIVGGWDASGPQVYRVFRKKGKVWKDRARGPVALGSGQIYALRVFRNEDDGYKYNMAPEAAITLAFRGLFNATYFDKHSGGELKVYHIDESIGMYEPPSKNALEAYREHYDLRLLEEPKTLFLVVDVGTQHLSTQRISSNDLVEHFKTSSNAKVFASHRVALLKWGDDRFYFHRLVFESEDDAAMAYGTATPHAPTAPYLQEFPGQVILYNKQPSVTVYVNWSSRGLLDTLHARCVNVILDCLGDKYFLRNISCLSSGGWLVTIGPTCNTSAQDSYNSTLERHQVEACSLRNRDSKEKAEIVEEVKKHVWPAIEAGKVKAYENNIKPYPFKHAAEAHKRMENGNFIGKILLSP